MTDPTGMRGQFSDMSTSCTAGAMQFDQQTWDGISALIQGGPKVIASAIGSAYNHAGGGIKGFFAAVNTANPAYHLMQDTSDLLSALASGNCAAYVNAAAHLISDALVFGGVAKLVSRAGVSVSGPVAAVSSASPGDHIVLGLRNYGLRATAAKVGGRTLLGESDFRTALLQAIADPTTRFTVALDGLDGTTPYSQVMNAVRNGLTPAASPTNWELAQLYQAGRFPGVTLWRVANRSPIRSWDKYGTNLVLISCVSNVDLYGGHGPTSASSHKDRDLPVSNRCAIPGCVGSETAQPPKWFEYPTGAAREGEMLLENSGVLGEDGNVYVVEGTGYSGYVVTGPVQLHEDDGEYYEDSALPRPFND